MLGNVVPLWEVMLAAMKLGAVVVPATTLLTGADLAERVGRAGCALRGGRRAGCRQAGGADGGDLHHGGRVGAGLRRLCRAAGRRPRRSRRMGRPRPVDPMLLYFTSGTTARPKLVLHNHRSYPIGHLSTMYWLGLQPRRHPSERVIRRLGQACLVLPVRAVECRGGGVHRQPAALRCQGAAGCDRRAWRDHAVRTADGVADADPAGSDAMADEGCGSCAAPASR